MEMSMRVLLPILTALLLVAGCTAAPPEAASSTAAQEGNVLHITGRVVHVPIEGGFFGIEGEDGTHYDPVNLSEDFRKDGLRVRVTARPREEVVSIRMWGRIIEIIAIEKM